MKKLPIILLLTGAIFIGFGPIFAKLAMDEGQIGPVVTAFWRMALSLPFFLIFLLFEKKTQKQRLSIIAFDWRLVIPGSFLVLDMSLWHWSFEFIPVANATLIVNISAIIVSLIGWLWLKEKLNFFFLIGFMLAILGISLLFIDSPSDFFHGKSSIFGHLLVFVAAFFYAGYLISAKQLQKKYSVLELLVCISLVGSLVLLLLALIIGESFWPVSSNGWIYMLLLTVVVHCLGQGLIVYAFGKLPASFSSVTLLLQPVGAAFWGWLFLAQSLSWLQVVAGLVVITGVFLAQSGAVRE